MNAPAPIPWQGASRTPRKWQADALPIVVDAMRRRVRGLVSATPGSGKSVLAAEIAWLALLKLGTRVIVFSAPRLMLVDQLAGTIGERVGHDTVGVFHGKRKEAHRQIVVCSNASLPALSLELAERGRRVALLVVDEAHSSEADTLRETIPTLNAICVLGFTGTPFRSAPEQTISLFTEILYRYTMQEAISDGVLVPHRVERFRGTDPGTLDEVCLDLMREHTAGPGIFSARGIEDAEEFAAWLTEQGEPSEAIHSKHSKAERDIKLAKLRAGELRTLVHVSLLAEGVDFPWLRWIGMRRNVDASVRTIQESMRVLRALLDAMDIERFGPKVDGVILDPHLIFGRRGWETSEAIGQALEEAAEAEEAEPTAVRGEREIKEQEAVALDLLLVYLGDARRELLDSSIVDPRAVPDGGWMLAPVSQGQVDALKKASKLTRHIPHEEHRDAMKALVKVPWALTKGQASDLLDVLFGGARWCRESAKRTGREPWRVQWPARSLEMEPPDAGQVHEITKLGRRKLPRRT